MKGAVVNAMYGASLFALGASMALEVPKKGLTGFVVWIGAVALLMVLLLAVYGYTEKEGDSQ